VEEDFPKPNATDKEGRREQVDVFQEGTSRPLSGEALQHTKEKKIAIKEK